MQLSDITTVDVSKMTETQKVQLLVLCLNSRKFQTKKLNFSQILNSTSPIPTLISPIMNMRSESSNSHYSVPTDMREDDDYELDPRGSDWHCVYGCGRSYRPTSRRSIKQHHCECFKLNFPMFSEITDKEITRLMSLAGSRIDLKFQTGLITRSQSKRRNPDELNESEKWYCPLQCGVFYRSTSTKSIKRHINNPDECAMHPLHKNLISNKRKSPIVKEDKKLKKIRFQKPEVARSSEFARAFAEAQAAANTQNIPRIQTIPNQMFERAIPAIVIGAESNPTHENSAGQRGLSEKIQHSQLIKTIENQTNAEVDDEDLSNPLSKRYRAAIAILRDIEVIEAEKARKKLQRSSMKIEGVLAQSGMPTIHQLMTQEPIVNVVNLRTVNKFQCFSKGRVLVPSSPVLGLMQQQPQCSQSIQEQIMMQQSHLMENNRHTASLNSTVRVN